MSSLLLTIVSSCDYPTLDGLSSSHFAFASSLLFLSMADVQKIKISPSRLSTSCILIIAVASAERFAYKGVASNMVTYLTEVAQLGTSAAAKTVNCWVGVTSMLPLAGAFLADSLWDRHSTILFSALLYVAGLGALTTWALLEKQLPTSTLFIPLYLISIGQGGYNPSLQAFGADQIEQDQKSQFFQWWYFGICAGSLLGNSLMPYLQDNHGWVIGFAVPTAVMALSAVAFAVTAGNFIASFKRALARRLTASKLIRLYGGQDGEESELEYVNFNAPRQLLKDLSSQNNVIFGRRLQRRMQGKPLKENELLRLKEEPVAGDVEEGATSPAPEGKSGASDMRKVILRLLPTWVALLMFAVIFQLPSTFFTRQGAAMERTIGGEFLLPPATLQSSITVSIILLMPLYNRLIVPCFKWATRREDGIMVKERIGVGMVLSVVAMVAAALVESRRGAAARSGGARLSIFWLLPQYVLLGVADVFTVVGMQEFFYGGMPSCMRTIGIGLYLSVFGVGSFLSSALIWAVERMTDGSWFSEDARVSHLDRFYWFLSILCAFSFILFVLIN
ncbi:major facilitator superfamily protein [Wolffia australiana]